MSAVNQYKRSEMTIEALAVFVGVKPQIFYVWLRKDIGANNKSPID